MRRSGRAARQGARRPTRPRRDRGRGHVPHQAREGDRAMPQALARGAGEDRARGIDVRRISATGTRHDRTHHRRQGNRGGTARARSPPRCSGSRASTTSSRASRSCWSARIRRAPSMCATRSKQTVEAGMRSFDHRLPEDASESEVLALVDKLNADPAVHGILVQLAAAEADRQPEGAERDRSRARTWTASIRSMPDGSRPACRR